MDTLNVQTYGRDHFEPGEDLPFDASWQLSESPESIEVRLTWFTEGKGDRDLEVVDSIRYDRPRLMDRVEGRFKIPAKPYSFSGKLVSLIWTIEMLVHPGNASQRQDVVVGPGAKEVVLQRGSGKDALL